MYPERNARFNERKSLGGYTNYDNNNNNHNYNNNDNYDNNNNNHKDNNNNNCDNNCQVENNYIECRPCECKKCILCNEATISQCEAKLFCETTNRLICELRRSKNIQELREIMDAINCLFLSSAKKEQALAEFINAYSRWCPIKECCNCDCGCDCDCNCDCNCDCDCDWK